MLLQSIPTLFVRAENVKTDLCKSISSGILYFFRSTYLPLR